MNEYSNAQDRAISCIAEALKLEPSKILKNSKLIEDLGADSLDSVEIIMSLEQEFDIVISEQEAVNFTTVDDLIYHIYQKISKDT